MSGQAAVRSATYDYGAADDAYSAVLAAIQTTYLQAAIRYAYFVDVALRDGLPTQENRAEGWGFWRTVAPFVAEKDADGAAAVTAIFDLSKAVSNATNDYYFCTAKAVIMNALPAGVSSADIGTLENTGSIACGGVSRSPPAGGAVPAPPPQGPDDCTCSCCDAVSCPSYTHGMYYAGAAAQVRFCRYQFPPTGELKYRGARSVRIHQSTV